MTDCLAIPPEKLGQGSPIRLEVVTDGPALTRHFAEALLSEYRATLAAGRERAVFIVPVGPTGQYDLLAARCNATGQDLSRLVLITMDEYLGPDGGWIPASDPLSFRRHMQLHFFDKLDPRLAPPRESNLFPDPHDLAALPAAIERLGGVDVSFGGIGITGHLAFNDPPEPDEADDPDEFAARPTRIVSLNRETRLINSVSAARGNVERIPPRAVTIGMKEILAGRKLRFYVHRAWMSAMLRRVLHGPVTARAPASLMQRHPDAAIIATREVTKLPEPA